MESLVQLMNIGTHVFHTSVRGYVGAVVGWSLLLACIICLGWLAARILFAMAAYNDAMAKNNSDAMMWGLLIGFLGLIPGIIYLCIRNSQQRTVCCQKCGYWHSPYQPVCPQCGEPNPTAVPAQNPYQQIYADRARKELIAAIICFAAMIVVSIVFGIAIAAFAVNSALPYGF